jgi:hypothetical protein
MSGNSTGGDDILTGGDNSTNNWLYGDAEFMHGNSKGGDDILTGGDNSTNWLYGDALEMHGNSSGGDDRLISGTGTDHMWGDAQFMYDQATGGEDVFVFGPNNGNDFIYDFEQGRDLIEVNGMPFSLAVPIPTKAAAKIPAEGQAKLSKPFDFSDLDIEETADGDSVVHFDASNNVTVYGVTGLTFDDFIFIA